MIDLKSTLRAITLELRRELEGKYDAQGNWQPGDLERRLASIGVRRDRPPVPVDELTLSADDREARRVVDAFIQSRAEAGQGREPAVAEFGRKAAYSWANRLLALRCMEARGLIDEVILQKEIYGGRSLQHSRLARKDPTRCAGEDEGIFAVLFDEFVRRAEELPLLFDARAPEVVLRPSVSALKRCIALLSGTLAVKGQEPATDAAFTAPDALGWTYQFYQQEEKGRVDAWLKNKKGFKCEGADLVPKTALYTEPYMVRFLVQNSLGALWMRMHPDSRLYEKWAYYVLGADRAPAPKKQVSDITFLDPACGSGHFLVEAFELFHAMYLEEGTISDPAQICSAILERNLHGVDIDEHAVQIAALALVMKAKEKAPNFVPRRVNLVATNIRLPAGKEHLEAFLRKHPEDEPLKPALLAIFEGLAHADELGSLLQIEEPVDRELHHLRDQQLERERKAAAGTLFGPRKDQDWTAWKLEAIDRLRQHFGAEAQEDDLVSAFFGEAATKGLSLVDLLSRRYDVVAANPPYLGSKNMGSVLKHHIQKHFVGAKRDLYAAFILRCIQLSGAGRTAMVTQQSWMFLKQMHRIRAAVFAKTTVEVLGHLGPGAFEEISGAHVNVALFIIASAPASADHHLTAVRTSWDTPVSRRSFDLATGATRSDSRARFRVPQSALASLPAQPFVYWCSTTLLELLRSGRTYEAIAEVGYTASANQRFVRFHWEAPVSSRWRRYSKGGGFRRWAGLDWYVIDWGGNGERPAAYVREHYAADKYSLWMKSEPTVAPAIVWSEIGSGAMGARLCAAGSVISRKGPGIMGMTESDRADSIAFLNARISTHLLRVTCSGLEFAYPYVAKLHRPKGHVDAGVVGLAVQSSEYLATVDPCERQYVGDPARLQYVNAVAAIMATCEAILDDQATYCFQIDEQDRKAIDDEVGINAGSLPLVEGLDAVPTLPGDIAIPEALRNALAQLPRRPADAGAELTPVVLAAYAKASGDRSARLIEDPEADESDADEEGEAETDVLAVHPPMPSATAVEAAARNAGIHPISAYWILQTRSSANVRERSVYLRQRLAVLMLRLMGHRWPSELERGAPVPDWASSDGVIPITEGTPETTLVDRVRHRIADEMGLDGRVFERDFQEAVGQSLSEWLAADLIEQHVSQFKKRPFIWQIESAPARSGKLQNRRLPSNAPAFSCLVYYHRVDADLMPKLRTQYVGPLRTSFQTELTTLDGLKNRSVDQDARRLELEEKLEELKVFDARLDRVIIAGFTSARIDAVAAKEPLDKWTSRDGRAPAPATQAAFLGQECRYDPDLNDGVRVNLAPLQRAGLVATDVLGGNDAEKAIADRAEWRADERRWCREGKLPQPGWWSTAGDWH